MSQVDDELLALAELHAKLEERHRGALDKIAELGAECDRLERELAEARSYRAAQRRQRGPI